MLGAGGVIVGLVAVEIVLRLSTAALDFHFPTMRFTDDRFSERAGKVIEGNGVRYAFDSVGFRTADGVPPAADGQAVLFIGDSFTEGFGVNANETFPARTCDELRRRGFSVRCLNAGVTGFGTAHEARLLRTLLDRAELHVAAVVFQVLPNNDLRDNWEDGGFGIEDGKLVTWDPPHIPLPVRLRVALLENSFAHGSPVVKLVANAWVGSEGSDPHCDDAAFQLEDLLLKEVVAMTQGHRIPVVIAVCATSRELNGTSSRPYDERARLDFVAATVEKLHVPWLDSRNVVRAPEDYIPNDGHFSASGNALMGRALAEKLLPPASE